jgi:hypothetical protein
MMECDQNVSTKSLKKLIPLVFNNIQCFSPTPLEQRGYMKLALKRGHVLRGHMYHLELDLVLISSSGDPAYLTKLVKWVLASWDPH